jgi:hypothetical protein
LFFLSLLDLTMDRKKLDKTFKNFNNKLNKLVNTVHSIICSKLMDPDQKHNIKKTNENTRQKSFK